MLTQLEVFTPGVTTAPLPIGDGSPTSDLLRITNIDGLGPVKAAINSTQYGSVDGEFYDGSSVGSRNIVLTVKLNPDWATQTFDTLRSILYTYFMPKNAVTLHFTTDSMPDVQIVGYVESIDPNIFSKDQSYQVSIICPSPHFAARDATGIAGTTIAFADTTTTDFVYQGNINTGFVLDVTKAGANYTGEIRIFNQTVGTELFTVNTTVDDTHFARVSTVVGDKYAQQVLTTTGGGLNILGKVVPGSIWIPLRPGLNRFQVKTATAGLAWALHFYELYGGL